jgi:hypothetical protein
MHHWPADSTPDPEYHHNNVYQRNDDDDTALNTHPHFQHNADVMQQLLVHPGWKLVKKICKPSIKTRILDTDDREAFLYEAIRAQAIMEVLQLPRRIIRQHNKQYPQPCNNSSQSFDNDHT